jgi:hypothetical protein
VLFFICSLDMRLLAIDVDKESIIANVSTYGHVC